jgi:hypothetical protein
MDSWTNRISRLNPMQLHFVARNCNKRIFDSNCSRLSRGVRYGWPRRASVTVKLYHYQKTSLTVLIDLFTKPFSAYRFLVSMTLAPLQTHRVWERSSALSEVAVAAPEESSLAKHRWLSTNMLKSSVDKAPDSRIRRSHIKSCQVYLPYFSVVTKHIDTIARHWKPKQHKYIYYKNMNDLQGPKPWT